MKAADTSVVVAAFASWHENHDAANRALGTGVYLVQHCAIETYSVLTRLPAPHRAPGRIVLSFLAARFPRPSLKLSDAGFNAFLTGLAEQGIAGGAVYDALVAATAAEHAAVLLSCDRRARPIYERCGVRVQFI